MADKKNLSFVPSTSESDIQNVLKYDSSAFSGIPETQWNLDHIKGLLSDGWQLYSVVYENEIVAAVFLKKEDASLLTKHTSVRLHYRGNGFSHRIKEFVEDQAQTGGLNKIVNFNLEDNFRGTALNESHGYKKVGQIQADQVQFETWEKKVD